MSTPHQDDPLDSVLNLEDQYYDEGYQQGIADGSHAGRVEGRLFGFEKGFEKFMAMGKLHGGALILSARLEWRRDMSREMAPTNQDDLAGDSATPSKVKLENQEGNVSRSTEVSTGMASNVKRELSSQLLPLPQHTRLAKHVDTLLAWTEPATFSTTNDEDSVADFDDRFRRAQAKDRLISSVLRDSSEDGVNHVSRSDISPTPLEGKSTGRVRLERARVQPDGNIEDFGKSLRDVNVDSTT